MKITNKQLQQIIQEESIRYKKKMMLEAERETILKKLQEIDDCDMAMEEGLGDFINKAKTTMGLRWSPQQAEQYYNQTYAKQAPAYAQKLGINLDVLKAALINFMIENGGAAILAGNGQNAQWDANSQKFIKLASKLGGPGGNVGG